MTPASQRVNLSVRPATRSAREPKELIPRTSSDLVPEEEVRRACKSLGIEEWSTITELTVSADEARAILEEIGGEAREVALEDLREGLQIELEHGTRFMDVNVMNNHPILTGKIVLAHLEEPLPYHRRLAVAELEADLGRVVSARNALDQAEVGYPAGGRGRAA